MRLFLTAAVALLLASPAHAQLAPPNGLGVTFAHVHLNVGDVELHKRIWSEHFDGQVVVKGPLSTIKLPNMLVVLAGREPTGPSQGTAMDHFGFKVRNLQQVLAEWRADGMEVESEFTGAEGFPNAYVVAPDGVRLELQEDPELPVKATGYHVHFQANDYEGLMHWYADMFGATIRPRGTIQTTADLPGMNLSFAACEDTCGPTQGRAIDHIGFEVDGLEAFIQKLEARGLTMDTPYREIPAIELAIAYFTDPAGVRVELTEGFDKY